MGSIVSEAKLYVKGASTACFYLRDTDLPACHRANQNRLARIYPHPNQQAGDAVTGLR